jgi:hypothetical protein
VTPERWQEVERLYHAALPRTLSERDAWLSHECAGDDALRREVESLLAQASKVGDFLDTPALVVAARELAAASRPSLAILTSAPSTASIEANGQQFLVLELVDGGTCRQTASAS